MRYEPRFARPGALVDRIVPPMRVLGRGSRLLPPPKSPLLQPAPIRARFADQALGARATGRPAGRLERPTPSSTRRPLPPSPSPPAPADRPSANTPPPFLG